LSDLSPIQNTAFSAEWQVLAACASLNSRPERLSDAIRGPLDWPALLMQAEQHGVFPLLAASLREVITDDPPLEIQTQLRSWQRAQAVFTLTLTAELFQVLERLLAFDIEARVTKGPALSVRCYGNAGMRQYGDLDLIVRDKDIERTTRTMLELGFEPKIPLSAIQVSKIPGEYVFTRNDKKIHIEFHTERTFRYYPQRPNIEQLFQRRAYVMIDGREVPALSIEDELVLICIHGAKHFWERLLWIADVAALVSGKNAVDWERAWAAAHEVGAERLLRLGLRLAIDVAGAALPEQVAAQVRSDSTTARLTAQIAKRLVAEDTPKMGIVERAAFRVKMRGGFWAGLAYLMRLSLSPTEEDWLADPETERSWLRDALDRPLRLAKKHGRNSET
jgi:hypothetical protein